MVWLHSLKSDSLSRLSSWVKRRGRSPRAPKLHSSRPESTRTAQQLETGGTDRLGFQSTETVPSLISSEVHPPAESNNSATTSNLELQETLEQHSDVLEVEYPLTTKERLRRLEPSTALRLKVDPSGRFSPENAAKLRQFKTFVSLNTSRLCKKLLFPEVKLSLVALVDESGRHEALICVEGLAMDIEIERFHLVISQRDVRQHYAPLRVCYQRALLALDTTHGIIAAQYIPPAEERYQAAFRHYMFERPDIQSTRTRNKLRRLFKQHYDTREFAQSPRFSLDSSRSERRALDPGAHPPIVIE